MLIPRNLNLHVYEYTIIIVYTPYLIPRNLNLHVYEYTIIIVYTP